MIGLSGQFKELENEIFILVTYATTTAQDLLNELGEPKTERATNQAINAIRLRDQCKKIDVLMNGTLEKDKNGIA